MLFTGRPMTKRESRRIERPLTPDEQERLERYRSEIDEELPEIIQRSQKRREAQQEPTVSGALRRAVQNNAMPLTDVAEQTGIPAIRLDEFLAAETTLTSDEVDRLAGVLSLKLELSVDGSSASESQ